MLLARIYSKISREDYITILCLLKLKGVDPYGVSKYREYIDIVPTASGGISIMFDYLSPDKTYRKYSIEDILEIISEANPIEVYFV